MEIWTQNLTDRSVSVIDATGTLLEGRRGLASAASQQIATIGGERRMSAAEVRGKQLFYAAAEIDADKQPAEIQDPTRMSQDGYLSCATCHLDGGHDGRSWDFSHRGEGLRNTISLRGKGGMSQGNVHWSANFDEIQDFENDIRNHFGGGGFLADRDWRASSATLGAPKSGRSDDLDALASYVASLGPATVPRSPHRAADGSLTDAARAGRDHFDSLNCASCHDPARGFTDSRRGVPLLHDVGTLKETSGERLGGGDGSLAGIDTPTLLGLHASAPYLHDGTAGTLAAAFEQTTPGGDHDISSLTSAEQQELLAYLLQIDGRDDAGALPLEDAGRLVFTSTRTSSGEHRDEVVLTVARQGGSAGAVAVDFATMELQITGAATAGEDFVATAGTLHWADGEVGTQRITIVLLDDLDVDELAAEEFAVLLDQPRGGALLGEPSLARISLIENDKLLPAPQPVVEQRSATDEDEDGNGDSLGSRLVAGNRGGVNVALCSFTLDETFDDPDLWGANLVLYSTISRNSGDWPHVDAYLLRVGDAAALAPSDYEAAPVGLIAEDLVGVPIVDGERIELSLTQQSDFVQLLRDQGAAVGDQLVVKLVADGSFAKGWMRYEFATGGADADPAPAFELQTRRVLADPGRSIHIDLIDRRDHDARVDDGLPRPVPAQFRDLLPGESHRLRFQASEGPAGDG